MHNYYLCLVVTVWACSVISRTNSVAPYKQLNETQNGNSTKPGDGVTLVRRLGNQDTTSLDPACSAPDLNSCSPYATCMITPDSYNCSCNTGFIGNGYNCSDIDECMHNPYPCGPNATCANTIGTYYCICNQGFFGDGMNCSDIDECLTSNGGCAPLTNCTNNFGQPPSCGFCSSGFYQSGMYCLDVNECATGNGGCDPLTTCVNLIGAFPSCTPCPSGYYGSGFSGCEDINECLTGANACSKEGSQCTNTIGSYTCACLQGYTGSGYTCQDVNECIEETANCSASASCTNTVGGYNCSCSAGFTGNGFICADIDECIQSIDTCGPLASCNNVIGSFFCTPAPSFADLYNTIQANSSIELHWEVPSPSLQFYYTLQISLDNQWETIYNGTQKNFTKLGLQSSTTYSFRLAATLDGTDEGSFTPVVNHTTSGEPSKPLPITFPRYGRNYILATWEAPEFDGGAVVTGYAVWFSENASVWDLLHIGDGQTTSVTFSALATQTRYFFYFQASNMFGESSPSEVSDFVTAPSFCGDGFCDINENCSCFFDCDTCDYPACPGVPECSNNGNCSQGNCICSSDYYGPDCSLSAGTVNVAVSISLVQQSIALIITPTTTFPNSKEVPIEFLVIVTNITEVDPLGNIVKFYEINPQNFSSSSTELILPDNSTVKTINCTFFLPGTATLLVTITLYERSKTIYFADRQVDVENHGVKYTMKISNWAFAAIENRLAVVVRSSANQKVDQFISTSLGGSSNVQWMRLFTNEVSLYVKFLEYAIIDGEVRKVEFAYVKSEVGVEIHSIIPHFWESAEIDPTYSVLLENESGNNKILSSVEIAIVVTTVAVSIAVAVGMCYVVKLKYKRRRRIFSMRRPVQALKSPSPSHEPITRYEVDLSMTPSTYRSPRVSPVATHPMLPVHLT